MISRVIAVGALSVCATASGAMTISSAAGASGSHRTAAINAVVIRQLVTVNHTFGGTDPSFAVIYIINGPVPDAADPTRTIAELAATDPYEPAVKRALRRRLDDLAPVTFVSDRETVVTGTPPGHVIENGVLVTLGPIEGSGDRVEIDASLWINGLAGQWVTYVVERQGGHWTVTGTTGPVSIS